ncbi:hypothetical protein B0H12DRAFT_1069671 [Mycena haematopus]|nr:hypothetical protein B0H12DRAFT_1069671 [Mycena haematopus]
MQAVTHRGRQSTCTTCVDRAAHEPRVSDSLLTPDDRKITACGLKTSSIRYVQGGNSQPYGPQEMMHLPVPSFRARPQSVLSGAVISEMPEIRIIKERAYFACIIGGDAQMITTAESRATPLLEVIDISVRHTHHCRGGKGELRIGDIRLYRPAIRCTYTDPSIFGGEPVMHLRWRTRPSQLQLR